MQLDARGGKEAFERLQGRTGLPPLDARDDGLRSAGLFGEVALAETGAHPRFAQECGGCSHVE